MPSRRDTFLSAFSERPLAKSFVWSLLLHLLFAALLFGAAGKSHKGFTPITVLLAGDLPEGYKSEGRAGPSRPKTSTDKEAKRNSGKGRGRAPKPRTWPGSEQLFSVSDTSRRDPVPDPSAVAEAPASLGRETAVAGREVGTDLGASEFDGNGETGYNAGGIGGSGRGGVPGLGQGHHTGGGGNASYLSANFGYIRDRILKGLSYPAQARRMGWKGRVTISFTISDNGCVENIRVLESSGHEILDAHAVKVIKTCQPFPKPPIRAEVVIPIVFRIG
jgi:periplasmic protein TonB